MIQALRIELLITLLHLSIAYYVTCFVRFRQAQFLPVKSGQFQARGLPLSFSVNRVKDQVGIGYHILLTINSLFRGLPNYGWAVVNLAELAWHVGNMVEISNEVNKM